MNRACSLLFFAAAVCSLCLGQESTRKQVDDAVRGLETVGALVHELGDLQGDGGGIGVVLPWQEIQLPVKGDMAFLRRCSAGVEVHLQTKTEHVVCRTDGSVATRIKATEALKPPAYGFGGRQIVWSSRRIMDYSESPARTVYETDVFGMTHLIDIGEGAIAVAGKGDQVFLLRFDASFGLLNAEPIDAKLRSGPGNDVLHYPKLGEIHIITSAGSLYRYGYDGKLKQRLETPGGAGPNNVYFHSRIDSVDRFYWASQKDEVVYAYGAKSGDEIGEMSYALIKLTRADSFGNYIQMCANGEWLFLTGNDSSTMSGENQRSIRLCWSNILRDYPPGFLPQRIPPLVWKEYVLKPAGHNLFMLDRNTGKVVYRLACGQQPDEPGSLMPSLHFYSRKHRKDSFHADSICFDGNRVYAVGGPRELYPSLYYWDIPAKDARAKAVGGE